MQEKCYRIRRALCHHCMLYGSVAVVLLNYSQTYAVLEMVSVLIKLAVFCNLLREGNTKFSFCWSSRLL